MFVFEKTKCSLIYKFQQINGYCDYFHDIRYENEWNGDGTKSQKLKTTKIISTGRRHGKKIYCTLGKIKNISVWASVWLETCKEGGKFVFKLECSVCELKIWISLQSLQIWITGKYIHLTGGGSLVRDLICTYCVS